MTLEQVCKDFIIKRVFIGDKEITDQAELEKYKNSDGKIFLDLDCPTMYVHKFGFGFIITKE